MQSANQLVEELQPRLESAESSFHRAYWDSQIEATPENEQERAQLELEVRTIKGDRAAYEAVESALQEEVHDPMVKRQLEVLRLSLAANQMDEADRSEMVALSSAIESEFASFRPEIDGKRLSDNDIDEVLKTSEDPPARKQVWFASKKVGDRLAPRILELVRVRNKVAHELGFSDYYRMALDLQEISEPWLFGLLDELDALTEKPFRLWKDELDDRLARRFGEPAARPWHYSDPFFQSVPPDGRVDLTPHLKGHPAEDLARRTFQGWGIDISAVLEASDLYPRELKCQHAFCLDVDRSGRDVRILANIVPTETWVETLLHESGHAAYDVSIDPNLPWVLRRAAHTFVTEAIAIMSGGLLRDPKWLTDVAGIDAAEIENLTKELRYATAIQKLVFARWGLVMVNFERDLYSDPEADHDARWWELVERFQMVAPPDEPPPGAWAAKIHLAVAPVYYHNYLLGELLAAQLRSAITSHCGGLVGESAAGEFLVDRVFRHGQVLRWDSLIEAAAGEPLSARDFATAL